MPSLAHVNSISAENLAARSKTQGENEDYHNHHHHHHHHHHFRKVKTFLDELPLTSFSQPCSGEEGDGMCPKPTADPAYDVSGNVTLSRRHRRLEEEKSAEGQIANKNETCVKENAAVVISSAASAAAEATQIMPNPSTTDPKSASSHAKEPQSKRRGNNAWDSFFNRLTGAATKRRKARHASPENIFSASASCGGFDGEDEDNNISGTTRDVPLQYLGPNLSPVGQGTQGRGDGARRWASVCDDDHVDPFDDSQSLGGDSNFDYYDDDHNGFYYNGDRYEHNAHHRHDRNDSFTDLVIDSTDASDPAMDPQLDQRRACAAQFWWAPPWFAATGTKANKKNSNRLLSSKEVGRNRGRRGGRDEKRDHYNSDGGGCCPPIASCGKQLFSLASLAGAIAILTVVITTITIGTTLYFFSIRSAENAAKSSTVMLMEKTEMRLFSLVNSADYLSSSIQFAIRAQTRFPLPTEDQLTHWIVDHVNNGSSLPPPPQHPPRPTTTATTTRASSGATNMNTSASFETIVEASSLQDAVYRKAGGGGNVFYGQAGPIDGVGGEGTDDSATAMNLGNDSHDDRTNANNQSHHHRHPYRGRRYSVGWWLKWQSLTLHQAHFSELQLIRFGFTDGARVGTTRYGGDSSSLSKSFFTILEKARDQSQHNKSSTAFLSISHDKGFSLSSSSVVSSQSSSSSSAGSNLPFRSVFEVILNQDGDEVSRITKADSFDPRAQPFFGAEKNLFERSWSPVTFPSFYGIPIIRHTFSLFNASNVYLGQGEMQLRLNSLRRLASSRRPTVGTEVFVLDEKSNVVVSSLHRPAFTVTYVPANFDMRTYPEAGRCALSNETYLEPQSRERTDDGSGGDEGGGGDHGETVNTSGLGTFSTTSSNGTEIFYGSSEESGGGEGEERRAPIPTMLLRALYCTTNVTTFGHRPLFEAYTRVPPSRGEIVKRTIEGNDYFVMSRTFSFLLSGSGANSLVGEDTEDESSSSSANSAGTFGGGRACDGEYPTNEKDGVTCGGDMYQSGSLSRNDTGLQWRVIVIVPYREIMSSLTHGIQGAIVLCAVISVTVVVIVFCLVRLVFVPLNAVARAMQSGEYLLGNVGPEDEENVGDDDVRFEDGSRLGSLEKPLLLGQAEEHLLSSENKKAKKRNGGGKATAAGTAKERPKPLPRTLSYLSDVAAIQQAYWTMADELRLLRGYIPEHVCEQLLSKNSNNKSGGRKNNKKRDTDTSISRKNSKHEKKKPRDNRAPIKSCEVRATSEENKKRSRTAQFESMKENDDHKLKARPQQPNTAVLRRGCCCRCSCSDCDCECTSEKSNFSLCQTIRHLWCGPPPSAKRSPPLQKLPHQDGGAEGGEGFGRDEILLAQLNSGGVEREAAESEQQEGNSRTIDKIVSSGQAAPDGFAFPSTFKITMPSSEVSEEASMRDDGPQITCAYCPDDEHENHLQWGQQRNSRLPYASNASSNNSTGNNEGEKEGPWAMTEEGEEEMLFMIPPEALEALAEEEGGDVDMANLDPYCVMKVPSRKENDRDMLVTHKNKEKGCLFGGNNISRSSPPPLSSDYPSYDHTSSSSEPFLHLRIPPEALAEIAEEEGRTIEDITENMAETVCTIKMPPPPIGTATHCSYQQGFAWGADNSGEHARLNYYNYNNSGDAVYPADPHAHAHRLLVSVNPYSSYCYFPPQPHMHDVACVNAVAPQQQAAPQQIISHIHHFSHRIPHQNDTAANAICSMHGGHAIYQHQCQEQHTYHHQTMASPHTEYHYQNVNTGGPLVGAPQRDEPHPHHQQRQILSAAPAATFQTRLVSGGPHEAWALSVEPAVVDEGRNEGDATRGRREEGEADAAAAATTTAAETAPSTIAGTAAAFSYFELTSCPTAARQRDDDILVRRHFNTYKAYTAEGPFAGMLYSNNDQQHYRLCRRKKTTASTGECNNVGDTGRGENDGYEYYYTDAAGVLRLLKEIREVGGGGAADCGGTKFIDPNGRMLVCSDMNGRNCRSRAILSLLSPSNAGLSNHDSAKNTAGLGLENSLAGRYVSVAVINLVGFHAYAATTPAARIVKDHEVLVQFIHEAAKRCGGVLDTFSGDKFWVSFNAASRCDEHAIAATLFACEVAGAINKDAAAHHLYLLSQNEEDTADAEPQQPYSSPRDKQHQHHHALFGDGVGGSGGESKATKRGDRHSSGSSSSNSQRHHNNHWRSNALGKAENLSPSSPPPVCGAFDKSLTTTASNSSSSSQKKRSLPSRSHTPMPRPHPSQQTYKLHNTSMTEGPEQVEKKKKNSQNLSENQHDTEEQQVGAGKRQLALQEEGAEGHAKFAENRSTTSRNRPPQTVGGAPPQIRFAAALGGATAGVTTGKAFVGPMGTSKIRRHTIISSCIPQAAALERLAARYPDCGVMVGGDMIPAIEGYFQYLLVDAVALPGCGGKRRRIASVKGPISNPPHHFFPKHLLSSALASFGVVASESSSSSYDTSTQLPRHNPYGDANACFNAFLEGRTGDVAALLSKISRHIEESIAFHNRQGQKIQEQGGERGGGILLSENNNGSQHIVMVSDNKGNPRDSPTPSATAFLGSQILSPHECQSIAATAQGLALLSQQTDGRKYRNPVGSLF